MSNQSYNNHQHRRSTSNGTQVDEEQFLSIAVPQPPLAVTSEADTSNSAFNSRNDSHPFEEYPVNRPAVTFPDLNNDVSAQNDLSPSGHGVYPTSHPAVVPPPTDECDNNNQNNNIKFGNPDQDFKNDKNVDGQTGLKSDIHHQHRHYNSPFNSMNWNALRHWVRPHLRKQSLSVPQTKADIHGSSNNNERNELGKNTITYQLLQDQEELNKIDEVLNNPSRLALYVPGNDVQFADSIGDLEINAMDFATLVQNIYDNPEQQNTSTSRKPVDQTGTVYSDVPMFNITEPDSSQITHKAAHFDQSKTTGATVTTTNTSSSKTNVSDKKNGGEKMFWLDITAPSEEEMEALANTFGLHSLTVEDIMFEPPSTDKFESFKNYDFMCFRALTPAHEFSPQLVFEKEKALKHKSKDSAKSNARRSLSSFIGGSAPVVKRTGTTNTYNNAHSRASSIRIKGNTKAKFRLSSEKPKDLAYKNIAPNRRSSDSARNAAEAIAENEDYTSVALGHMNTENTNLERRDTLHNHYLGSIKSNVDNIGNHQDRFERRSNVSWNEGYVDYDQEKTVPLFIVLIHRGVLTFHNSPLSATRKAIARLMDDSIDTVIIPSYAAYAVMDNVIDELLPVSRLLEIEADAVDELVLILTQGEQADMLRRISTERRKVLWMLRILQGKKEVVRALERRVSDRIKYFQDLAMHNNNLFHKYQPRHRKHHVLSPTTRQKDNEDRSRGEPNRPIHASQSLPCLYNDHIIDSNVDSNRNNDFLSFDTATDIGNRMGNQRESAFNTRAQGLSEPPDVMPAISNDVRRISGSHLHHSDSLSGLYGLNHQHQLPHTNYYASSGIFGGSPKGFPGPGSYQDKIPFWTTLTDMSRYLNDIQDHLETMSGSIYHCERILSRANLNFMTRVNLMMTSSSFETNGVMANLTTVTVIFLPLNLVSSLWGMNVRVPGQNNDERTNEWQFFTILGSMGLWALTCVVAIYIIKPRL
ncbi:Mg(2+) transporter [Mycoemilia scoparia]|uniref:Mg(2+) transporter n=1 Tax=Mycoemilia scoparia TaxID=417184 RepID=A0A9W7ZPZ8_9FUNG|nr:Mg(2+) transporter [Mycoemilia scoparia]